MLHRNSLNILIVQGGILFSYNTVLVVLCSIWCHLHQSHIHVRLERVYLGAVSSLNINLVFRFHKMKYGNVFTWRKYVFPFILPTRDSKIWYIPQFVDVISIFTAHQAKKAFKASHLTIAINFRIWQINQQRFIL